MPGIRVETTERTAAPNLRVEALRHIGVEANALAQCGRIADAENLISVATENSDGTLPFHPFAAVRGYIAIQRSGDIDAAYNDQLLALEEEDARSDPRTFNEILGTMIMCAHVRGNAAWWRVAVAIGTEHRTELDPVIAFTLDSYSHYEPEKWAQPTSRWRQVEASATSGPAWKNTTLLVAAANLNWRIDETRFIDRLLTRLNPDDHGLASLAVQFAFSRRNTGMWRDRGAQARSVLNAISGRGLYYLEARLRGFLSVTDAYLGNVSSAIAFASEAAAWAGPRGFKLVLEDTWHARTVMALASSDFEAAYAVLAEFPIEPHRWEISGHGAAEILNLAEACDKVGRPQDAVPAVYAAVVHGLGSQTPRQAMALRAAQAILEVDDDAADRLFTAALALEGAANSPFDTARVRLAFAGFLMSRRNDPVRARAHLMRALREFEVIGAREWAARTKREISKSRRSATESRAAAKLSPQEHLVASYAAQGLSNKEIAERLYISSRTVSYHLYNLFPKLGITSRAALRDALTRVDVSLAKSA